MAVKRILDIGGRGCILSSSERVSVAGNLAGVPVPHRSGMTPANVTEKYIRQDTDRFAELRLNSACCEQEKLTVCLGQVRQWSRLVNPGNGRVLDRALTLTSGSIESKTVPSYWKGCTSGHPLIPLNLQGKRVPEIHAENEVTDAER